MIRENDVFDSLLVKESERLVRGAAFVNDVLFYVVGGPKKTDSVDIFIRSLDKWSISGGFSNTNTKINPTLDEKNFFGLGHELKLDYVWHIDNGQDAYKLNYFVPSFRNTYINTSFRYETDEFKSTIKGVNINRPFYSAYTKWSAGINFEQYFRKDSIRLRDSTYQRQNYRNNSEDYWLGRALQIFKGNAEDNRSTSFITTLRLLRTRYLEKPDESFDTLHSYTTGNFYLIGFGIATRKYVQEKYIFRYGATEDVPIGQLISITLGLQQKFHTQRSYMATKIAFGKYYQVGYLNADIEYGNFFHESHAQEGILSLGITYFTDLLKLGRWRCRQFIKQSTTIGINRNKKDSLTINNENGIDGFSSDVLSGKSRFLLTSQTQFYAPWNVLGFRFGPFLTYAMGMLKDEETGFHKSKVYSQLGIGFLIKNENLIINTFQVSISFYPIIPGRGNNILKINSLKTTDFGLRDFGIDKPSPVEYK